MPASHGEDAVLRVLDKENALREISQSQPGRSRLFSADENAPLSAVIIREPYGMVLVTGPTRFG